MRILEAGSNVNVYYVTPAAKMDGNEIDRFLKDRGFGNYEDDADNHSDRQIEMAGRVCYMSFGENRRKATDEQSQSERYIENILETGHGSVTEHPHRSFIITGIDRNLTHELVRHRVGVGYSQLSSRYVDLRTYAFIVPQRIKADSELFEAWKHSIQTALDAYTLINDKIVATDKCEKKVAREDAMSVLPGCVETIMYFTVNVRALRHILFMRGALSAKKDIRSMAVKLFKLVQHEKAFRHIELKMDEKRGEYLVNHKPKV